MTRMWVDCRYIASNYVTCFSKNEKKICLISRNLNNPISTDQHESSSPNEHLQCRNINSIKPTVFPLEEHVVLLNWLVNIPGTTHSSRKGNKISLFDCYCLSIFGCHCHLPFQNVATFCGIVMPGEF